MTTALSRLFRSRIVAALSLTSVLTLALSRPAIAQSLWRVSGVMEAARLGVYGTDIGYDPSTGQYLVVAAAGGATAIVGACVNSAGVPSSLGYFTVAAIPNSQGPRVKYSPHLANGVGGAGAFVVAWNASGTVYSQVVSCASPSRLIGGLVPLGIPGLAAAMGPPIAYSPISQRFLVVSVG